MRLSTEKDTALHYAARQGHVECVRLLVNHSPGLINTTNIWGQTPLVAAAGSGSIESALAVLDADSEAYR